MSQAATVPRTHTRFLCQCRVKAPVPEKMQKIGLVALFASRGRGSSTCRLCGDCQWVTLQIAHTYRSKEWKKLLAHFLVAHWSTELYSATRTRLQYGWLRLKMCRSLCSQGRMSQAATVPRTHTRFLCQCRVKAPVPEKIQRLV